MVGTVVWLPEFGFFIEMIHEKSTEFQNDFICFLLQRSKFASKRDWSRKGKQAQISYWLGQGWCFYKISLIYFTFLTKCGYRGYHFCSDFGYRSDWLIRLTKTIKNFRINKSVLTTDMTFGTYSTIVLSRTSTLNVVFHTLYIVICFTAPPKPTSNSLFSI